MNRRDFFRRVAAAAGPVAVGLWAAGCATRPKLLRDPEPPLFGSRRAGSAGILSPTAPSPCGPSTAAAYNNPAAWQIQGRERAWRFIVVHHSATATGCAAEFDRMHRARGWDELGYHFVIGNGTGSPDGLIEVGSRWYKQKHGAHCKVAGHPEYNDFGIGICLVGNFSETRPSERQMAALAQLVRYLQARYRIPKSRVYGHGQLKATECPGRYFPYDDLFRRLG